MSLLVHEGCEGVTVLVVGCEGCEGVTVLVVGCEDCEGVECAADPFLGLPVSVDTLWLPLWCSKSCRCVRECLSLILELSLMTLVLSCVGS